MRQWAIAGLALVAFVGLARGEEKKSDLAGKWNSTVKVNDQTHESTIEFKVEGDKVTGKVTREGREMKVEDGKLKDGEVTFKITLERDDQKFVVKFKGKLEGAAIKGKAEIEGRDIEGEWEAKREKT